MSKDKLNTFILRELCEKNTAVSNDNFEYLRKASKEVSNVCPSYAAHLSREAFKIAMKEGINLPDSIIKEHCYKCGLPIKVPIDIKKNFLFDNYQQDNRKTHQNSSVCKLCGYNFLIN